MNNYRVEKEQDHIRVSKDTSFYIEADTVEEVKEYLTSKGMEFSRYGKFTNTVYYK